MNVRHGIALLGLFAAACSTNGQQSALVVTRVVEATQDTTTGQCSFDTGTNELVFSTLNPTSNIGEVAAVVQNNLVDPTNTNSVTQVNSSQFQPHQFVVNYEALPRSAGAAAPYTIPQQIVATGGVVVQPASTGTVAAPLFLPGVLPAGAATGDIIRVSFHIEGVTADGRKVSTNDREYLFRICTTCTTNACL